MRKIIFALAVSCSLNFYCQHEHHQSEAITGSDSSGMTHAFSLNLPMNRNGSGTAWLPDSTPMFGFMMHKNKWMFMLHGNIFIRYNQQDIFNSGTRGGEKADAVSWFMLMGQKRTGKKGLFRFSAMLSPDALFGENGYPLLFQTGESYKGEPLVDRQHPHDLFSELSVAYTYSPNRHYDLYLYIGYPGEPAIGSVAFMHRVSSLYNPDAPLSHHWNDATHITFGVITGGFRFNKFKLESSLFTGREPDEYRYNFDEPRFDSYSARLSYNPTVNLSFQISHGFINGPEYARPDVNINRSTASAVWSLPLRTDNFLNASVIWALNQSDHSEHAILAEAAVVVNKSAVYCRYEFVQKSIEELYIKESLGFDEHAIYNINALTAGFSYDLSKLQTASIALGGQVTAFVAAEGLRDLYGKYPVSAEIFIRIYPPRMRMGRLR